MARVLKVAAALSNPEGTTKRELVDTLECARKTIERDIAFLRERIGLQVELELVDASAKREGIEYRHRATNAAELRPVLDLVGRFVL